MTYFVCWNHNCRQTYPASDFNAEVMDVKCEKCGGTVVSPSGKVQLSRNPWVIKTIDPKSTMECQECRGSGFSGTGSGYDSVCDNCSGQGELPNPNYVNQGGN